MALVVCFRSAVSLIGRFPVLAGVDLDVEAGEVVLVRGPNGAGKTTLLRACAGLVPVTGGKAEVLGHDLRRDRRSVRRQVGLLGHASFLYEDLTVDENLVFAAQAAGRTRDDALAAMATLGLDGRLRHVAAGKLSAGQRRRAALASVIARRPSLWLLDEPHAGLDERSREVVTDLIRDAASTSSTVLMASHEIDYAAPLANRQVVIAGGRADGGLPAADTRPADLGLASASQS